MKHSKAYEIRQKFNDLEGLAGGRNQESGVRKAHLSKAVGSVREVEWQGHTPKPFMVMDSVISN